MRWYPVCAFVLQRTPLAGSLCCFKHYISCLLYLLTFLLCVTVYVVGVITCAPAMLEAGNVFVGVYVSVCPHKISETTDP